MKCLILSRSTGGGHNTAARAVAEAMTRKGVDATFVDAARFSNRLLHDGAGRTYVAVAKYAAPVFGAAYTLAGKLSSPNRKCVVYPCCWKGAKAMHAFIQEGGYDAIVTTHLFAAESLTYLKKHCGLKQPVFFVATDYTCTPFDEETEPDYFLLPNGEPGQSFLRRGVPKEKAIFTGIPVSAAFNTKLPQQEAKAALGLPLDRDCHLIMTGSMGYGSVDRLIDALLVREPRCLPVVLGGSNEKLKYRLREKFADWVRVVDFTDQVPLYMDACTLVFTKPGGLSSTEAAVKNVLLVHTAPIPGCETLNAQYFSSNGMSIAGGNPEQLVAQAVELLNDPQRREDMLANQRRCINPHAADDIADFVIERVTHP